MTLIRLLPLIALFAFGALLTGHGQSALAALNTFTVSTPTTAVGQQVTVRGELLNIPAGSTITITASNGFFISGSATAGGPSTAITGSGTSTLTFITTTPMGVAAFSGVWVCQTPGTTTFTLTQTPASATGVSTLSTTLACSTLAITPPTQATSVDASVNGTCTTTGQILTATGPGAFTSMSTPFTNVPPPFNMNVVSPSTAACASPGPFTINYVCSRDGIVTFNLQTTPAFVTCSGTPNPYEPVNQFCPMYNAVAPYGGGVAFPGTAPYTGSPFPYGYNGALNQTTGLPYAYGFAPTSPNNPSAPFNGVTYPPNYQSVVPYNGLTYPNNYNPMGTTPGIPGTMSGVPGVPYSTIPGTYGYNGNIPSYPNGAPVGTGTNYCPPNPPADVALATSSSTVACAGTSVIEVLVRDAAGLPVPNGQKVTLNTSFGSLNPVTVSTVNGKVESTFRAPATGSGVANISVVANSLSTGDISGATSINVDCPASATAPAPTPTLYNMPAMMPPSTGQGFVMPAIRPPSTGDAGLLATCLLDD
jgi:hypothetical protein